MNDVEANIAELVARLFPETFDALRRYRAQNADFLDPVLRAFDREVQFYLGYLDHVKACKAAGLAFCLPEVSDNDKEISCEAGFDLALARKLVREGQPIVTNDFRLAGAERVLVVSGPNQGGKTTFARMFGQLHYLASLGLPVPGKAARLYLCDRLFTHFEREEDMASHSGKLQDDLVRIHQILEETTPAASSS